MTTYAGDTCQLPGTSYAFGPRPGVIIYEYPTAHRPSTEKDSIVVGFKTRYPNAILLSVQCSVDGDYLLITLEQGNAHIRYNLGSFDHHVSELSVRVDDGKYHVLRFDRTEANSSLWLDDRPPRLHAPSDERQLFTLNMQYRVSLGGRPTETDHRRPSFLRLRRRLRRTSAGLVGRTLIERPFTGVLTGVNYNGLRILDMHAQGDGRIRQLGDIAI
uniref:Laminin G domain-containing protein n=1 Tax=Plectus sambesii TaxID=2011161 RepID=A0A914V1I2_9BILA